MTQRSPQPHQQAPWWLEGGTEECPHCGQRYHLEVERRCPECDSPSCPHCHGKHEDHCSACTGESRK